MTSVSTLPFLKSRLYAKSRFFNEKFHFGHKILFFKSRLLVKSRFIKSRLYCIYLSDFLVHNNCFLLGLFQLAIAIYLGHSFGEHAHMYNCTFALQTAKLSLQTVT